MKCAVIVTILLISAVSLAGCTGSSPATAATPAPVPVVTTVPATPAPAITTAPVAATAALTQATPGRGPSQTFTFEGSGDSTEKFTTATDRTWVFRMSSPAKEIFQVTIKDKNGDNVDVLAEASDVYAGTESVTLKAGTYYLEVFADSSWSITMSTE
jgi:ABC-type glycerol-3-phosphate transport system substrate-binding protein